MAFTLKQLLRHTPAVVQKGSRNTVVKKAKIIKRANGTNKLEAIVQRNIRDNRPHPPHKCSIEGIEPGNPKLSEGNVKVSCDCEAFVFWGIEWVLHKHGAADIIYGNGEAPNLKNPARLIYLGPHLTKLGLAVMFKKL